MKATHITLAGLILTIALVVSARFEKPGAALQNAVATAPRAFVTRRTGSFNGQRVRSVATVGETVLKDEAGAATASFFSTS